MYYWRVLPLGDMDFPSTIGFQVQNLFGCRTRDGLFPVTGVAIFSLLTTQASFLDCAHGVVPCTAAHLCKMDHNFSDVGV